MISYQDNEFRLLLLIVCTYTDVIALPVKVVLIAIACAIFAVGIAVAMEGERKIGFVTTRYLKCPHCGAKSWCKKVMSKEG